MKIKVTEYEDIECPLLGKMIGRVYCNQIQDVVLYYLADNSIIEDKFEDEEAAGRVCKNCEVASTKWKEVRSYYVEVVE